MLKIEMSKRLYQRQIPIILLSIVSFIVSIEYFLNIPDLTNIKNWLTLGVTHISNTVFLYGSTILLIHHIGQLRRPDQPIRFRRSLFFFLSLGSFGVLGLILGFKAVDWSYTYTTIVSACGLGMGGVAFLYAFPAILRLFRRVRTIEGIIFMISAFILFCKNTTSLVALFPPFLDIFTWLTSVPGKAAMRGAYMAAAVGVGIMCIRALIGKEPGLAEAEEIK